MIVKTATSSHSKLSIYIDIKTLLITLLLVFAGLVCVYSATININPDKFNRQLIAAGIGLVAMFIISRISVNNIKQYSFPFYVVMMVLLLGLFPLGSLGDYGTQGWYKFAGFSFQPSEFAKIALILSVANYLSVKGNSTGNILDIGKLTVIFLCPFILIFLQPDIGTALTLMILYFGLLYWAGADLYFGFFMSAFVTMFIISLTASTTAVLVVGGITAIVLLLFRKKIYIYIISLMIIVGVAFVSNNIFEVLPTHQQNRIKVFLEPETDIRGIGYNLTQSKLAVGSGGITGKGFKEGNITQYRYVPMQYTDFIYSVPAEEFGFVGAAVILLGLLYLCYRGINIAFQSKDIFCSLVAFGSSIIMLFHIVYNIGMVLGLFPVMGIPLPFFSHGGTFLISNLIYVGFLMNINRNNYRMG